VSADVSPIIAACRRVDTVYSPTPTVQLANSLVQRRVHARFAVLSRLMSWLFSSVFAAKRVSRS